MTLAQKVLDIHEDVKTAEEIIKSYLKPSPRSKNVEDFFFDVDVKDLSGWNYNPYDKENEDDPFNIDEWSGDLLAKKFSETLLAMCEGEDVTIEDCREFAPKVPALIKGLSFEIDSVKGRIEDSNGYTEMRVSQIVVAIAKAKYDPNKDELTGELEFEEIDLN